MSRSGYSEDCDDQWALIRWRGAVSSAIRGKKGQAFLRETLAALDALPEKRLVSDALIEPSGSVCTLGAVGVARRIEMGSLDPENYDAIAAAFGVPRAMAQEIMWLNDEAAGYWSKETPEQRFARMRDWLIKNIREPGA